MANLFFEWFLCRAGKKGAEPDGFLSHRDHGIWIPRNCMNMLYSQGRAQQNEQEEKGEKKTEGKYQLKKTEIQEASTRLDSFF